MSPTPADVVPLSAPAQLKSELRFVARGARAFGLVAALACGCTTGAEPTADGATTLRVFAASSLTDAFRELKRAFEAEHPSFNVELVFAGSQVLRTQLELGASADVFATAHAEHLESLVASGRFCAPTLFAENAVVLIVPSSESDSPDHEGIFDIGDLDQARRIVLGTDAVPIGRYARVVLDRAQERFGEDWRARVDAQVVSIESNTRLVRAKVELGAADAALVYRSDALSASSDGSTEARPGLRMVELPDELAVRGRYSIAVSSGSIGCGAAVADAGGAPTAWIDYVSSADGARLLARHGFDAPSSQASATVREGSTR